MEAPYWIHPALEPQAWQDAFPEIDSRAAAQRIAGEVQRTPLVRLPTPKGVEFELWGKMENRQETGSFKCRGALNNISLLSDAERERGVVASSSGNHGRALAWAARRAGVAATIVMAKYSYPNKIQACRDEGAEVVLAEDRLQADVLAKQLAEQGKVWVHPYNRMGTIEGAGTVGLEIVEDKPDVDVVVFCVGGGGMSAGGALAIRRVLGEKVIVIGAEPIGAAGLTRGLQEGKSIQLPEVTSELQGLTTPFAGNHNIEVCLRTLDATFTVSDEDTWSRQGLLVNDGPDWKGEVVEPAGAAAYTAACHPEFPALLRTIAERRGLTLPERTKVAVTISGGNPDPAQLASLRS